MKLAIAEVRENEDGTKTVVFDYDDEMLEVAKKEIGNDSPTEEEVSAFFVKIITAEVQRRQAEAAKAEQEAEPTEE